MDWSCLVWGTKMVLLWHHCETPVFKNAKSQDAGVILLDIHPPFFFFFLWLSLGMSWLGQKCRSAGMEAGMEGALCVNVWLFSEIFLFSFFFYVVQLDFKYCKPNAYGFSFLLICLRWMIYVCLQLCTVLHLQRSRTLRCLTPYMTMFPSVTCCPITAALELWWVRERFTAPRAAPGALLLLSAKVRI